MLNKKISTQRKESMHTAGGPSHLASEADFVWRAASISVVWVLGLILSFVWWSTWLGASLAGVTVAVIFLSRLLRRNWAAALLAGGICLSTISGLIWISLLAFFRIY